MEDDADFEMDPAIAEAMGFSGFGTQPGKKRKFDTQDAFIDPGVTGEAQSQHAGHGANNTPLGSKAVARGTDEVGLAAAATTAANGVPASDSYSSAQEAQTTVEQDPKDYSPAHLSALRQGIKNAAGDMVYFQPSFIEDPFHGLEPQ